MASFHHLLSRRPAGVAWGALAAACAVLCAAVPAAAEEAEPVTRPAARLADEPLISVWCHRSDVDLAPIIAEVGLNTVWTHDPPYDGQAWEDTMMYRALQAPGVRYVLAKIDRIQWGWTHEASVRHARWVAELSREHPGIIGLYLNDFYDEVEEGYRTMEQWREIIAAARDVNPDLQLWVPHYPHRGNVQRPYDFPHDAVIFNLWGTREIPRVAQHLAAAQAHHPGTPMIAGLYLSSGMRAERRWLTEEEFKTMLGLYVEEVNAGRLAGLRIFCACQLTERPEYRRWAKEILAGLKPAPPR